MINLQTYLISKKSLKALINNAKPMCIIKMEKYNHATIMKFSFCYTFPVTYISMFTSSGL